MAPREDSRQAERVRERFTRTAEQFARFSLAMRSAEAARLVALAAPRGDERALDVACGPGTFTHAFAPQVKFIAGIDLTAALLEKARRAGAEIGHANTAFLVGEAMALPYPDRVFDLVVCAYSAHHFADAELALHEISRVTRTGGRLALADIVVPHGADGAACTRIEQARDASHVQTYAASDFERMVRVAGFEPGKCEPSQRLRSFDDWMRIAGWEAGNASHTATRRLMESEGLAAGFQPRAGGPDIEFVQSSHFLVAEKK